MRSKSWREACRRQAGPKLRAERRAEVGSSARRDAELKLAVAERRLVQVLPPGASVPSLRKFLACSSRSNLGTRVLAGGVLVLHREGVRGGRRQQASGGNIRASQSQTRRMIPPNGLPTDAPGSDSVAGSVNAGGGRLPPHCRIVRAADNLAFSSVERGERRCHASLPISLCVLCWRSRWQRCRAPLHAADSYAGKTVELVVGAPPGGGYDIYARAVARHLGRHIPGEPTVVVKNMPGAGSAKAAQYIATIAPKDGTSIAGIMPGAIMGPLLDDRTAPLFDPTKVRYVGTANSGTRVCVTLKSGKIQNFEDAQKMKTKFGGSSPNDSTFEYGYLHKHTSGALWDIVPGYRGTPRWRSPWSAARSTASAAGTGRASARRSRTGCATTRPTS